MKYLLLIYSAEDAWEPDEHRVALADSIALCHQLNEHGQYVDAAPLHPVATAKHIRVRDGKRLVFDGPFTETKEHLAGFFLVDCESIEQAIDIAARIPGTTRGTTEIRPIVELTGMPMVHGATSTIPSAT